MFKITAIGHLGADPEMRYTQAGLAVANFNVAVKSRRKDKETGEPITYWLKCSAWGKQADLCAEYLRKGNRVALDGEGGLDTWTNKDGESRSAITLNIAEVEFLTPKSEQQGDYAPAGDYAPSPQRRTQRPPDTRGPADPSYQRGAQTVHAQPQPAYDRGDLDDLPF